MIERFIWLNPVFGFFGWRIVESRIGRWGVRDGAIVRDTFHLGWRFERLIDAVKLPDGDWTELDRVLAKHHDEIRARARSQRAPAPPMPTTIRKGGLS